MSVVESAVPGDAPLGARVVDKPVLVDGMVARDLPSHPVGPRPNRHYDSCAFAGLGGGTSMEMFLGQIAPGGTKCGHRHFDETLVYFVAGHGWSEFRQDDSAPLTRVEWRAGDLLATPANCWHEHFNPRDAQPARALTFKNSPMLRRLLGPGAAADLATARLRSRYDDEPDYFTRREVDAGVVTANFVPALVEEPIPADDPDLGDAVSMRTYAMGGQQTLEVSLVRIGPGGLMRQHRPLAEEAFYVLRGEGSTELWSQDRQERTTIAWQAGDLVACPSHVRRRHHSAGREVRLLRVRDVFVQHGYGESDPRALDAPLNDRFHQAYEGSWSAAG